MTYLDAYFSRVNHLGETTAERIRNGGIRSFYKWMDESPHTVRQLSIDRGLYFDAIILTSKDKEYQKIMFLNVANNIPLQVGDIMNWQIDDGSIEKWMLISEEKKVNGTYRTFWIVRCNYLIKWIDDDGHLQSSWSYFVSSLDSKIKGNYRTWNHLITPQPNKYAEILMPRREISRATNFIIEEESWQLIEYDHTSVPGTVYLSLTENKINNIYDDVENNIADLDKRAKYSLVLPPTIQIFNVGKSIQPIYTIMKNGVPINMDVELISLNKDVARTEKDENGRMVLKAKAAGEADIQVKLKDCTDIEPEDLYIHIQVAAQETEFSCYIKGDDKIRLGRSADYTLDIVGSIPTDENEAQATITFVIDKPEVASFPKVTTIDGESWIEYVSETKDNPCKITANSNNILDTFTLTVNFSTGQSFSKIIQIIPLW